MSAAIISAAAGSRPRVSAMAANATAAARVPFHGSSSETASASSSIATNANSAVSATVSCILNTMPIVASISSTAISASSAAVVARVGFATERKRNGLRFGTARKTIRRVPETRRGDKKPQHGDQPRGDDVAEDAAEQLESSARRPRTAADLPRAKALRPPTAATTRRHRRAPSSTSHRTPKRPPGSRGRAPTGLAGCRRPAGRRTSSAAAWLPRPR